MTLNDSLYVGLSNIIAMFLLASFQLDKGTPIWKVSMTTELALDSGDCTNY